MTDLITIDNIVKTYKKRKAVDHVSFTIQEGDIFGFIGPNGAGKTTTIRILTTLLQADSGRIIVDGLDVKRNKGDVRRKIGYVPDFFGVYNEMTATEYLDFFAGCYHIHRAKRPELISDLLTLVDLDHRRDDYVDNLSRGMKQRLGLARALIHDPKILVLDEPASGLDPRARVEFRALLKELQKMGKTIFFSSHILADVDELCTEVGIIEAGKIVACGNVNALREELRPQHTIYLTVIGEHLDETTLLLSQIPDVSNVTHQKNSRGDWDLEFNFTGNKLAVSELLKQLVLADIPLLNFKEERETLEDMFMKLTEGIVS